MYCFNTIFISRSESTELTASEHSKVCLPRQMFTTCKYRGDTGCIRCDVLKHWKISL
jgi:hypothetical protein